MKLNENPFSDRRTKSIHQMLKGAMSRQILSHYSGGQLLPLGQAGLHILYHSAGHRCLTKFSGWFYFDRTSVVACHHRSSGALVIISSAAGSFILMAFSDLCGP